MAHVTKTSDVIYFGLWRGYKALAFAGSLFVCFSFLIVWMKDFYQFGIDKSIYSFLMLFIPGLIMICSPRHITVVGNLLIETQRWFFFKKSKILDLKETKHFLVAEKSLYDAKPRFFANEPTEVIAVFLIKKDGEKYEISEFFPMTSSVDKNVEVAKQLSRKLHKPIIIDTRFARS